MKSDTVFPPPRCKAAPVPFSYGDTEAAVRCATYATYSLTHSSETPIPFVQYHTVSCNLSQTFDL